MMPGKETISDWKSRCKMKQMTLKMFNMVSVVPEELGQTVKYRLISPPVTLERFKSILGHFNSKSLQDKK